MSWAFLESIGGNISHPMDQKVGTAKGQGEGLQVVEVGVPWQVYLEGMNEDYSLEPLVIQ